MPYGTAQYIAEVYSENYVTKIGKVVYPLWVDSFVARIDSFAERMASTRNKEAFVQPIRKTEQQVLPKLSTAAQHDTGMYA